MEFNNNDLLTITYNLIILNQNMEKIAKSLSEIDSHLQSIDLNMIWGD